MNDLSMTFTSRLKVDAKCVYQQWNGITIANYFGAPPSWLSVWVSVFWAWRMDLNKGISMLFAYCEEKKLIHKFYFKFNQGTCPWMVFACNFFGIFLKKKNFEGGQWGQIIYREYVVFRGSYISCSQASASARALVAARECSIWDKPIVHFFFIFFFLQLHCPSGISPMGNSGCFPRGKPASTESRQPT